MVDLYIYVLVFLGGLVAGFVNVIAGGGSAITLPLLLLTGLSGAEANGTNRVALVLESASGAYSFHRQNISDLHLSLKLSVFTLPGAILGSIYAVNLSEEMFRIILITTLTIIFISLFIKNKKITPEHCSISFFLYPAMFLVGIYGGLIQAGIGFILIWSLRNLAALDLIRTNMHKTFIILIYLIPSLIVFILYNKVNYPLAITLGTGNALGAFLSARLSVHHGEKLIRPILGGVIVLFIAKISYELLN